MAPFEGPNDIEPLRQYLNPRLAPDAENTDIHRRSGTCAENCPGTAEAASPKRPRGITGGACTYLLELDRRWTESRNLRSGRTRIVWWTDAFSLGVNIADIDLVIQWAPHEFDLDEPRIIPVAKQHPLSKFGILVTWKTSSLVNTHVLGLYKEARSLKDAHRIARGDTAGKIVHGPEYRSRYSMGSDNSPVSTSSVPDHLPGTRRWCIFGLAQRAVLWPLFAWPRNQSEARLGLHPQTVSPAFERIRPTTRSVLETPGIHPPQSERATAGGYQYQVKRTLATVQFAHKQTWRSIGIDWREFETKFVKRTTSKSQHALYWKTDV